MLASKQFYKDHPDLKPERKTKKVKQNYDSISYLKELHGNEKLINMIGKMDNEKYNVNLRTGKIIKKRQSKSTVPENSETTPENTEMKQQEWTIYIYINSYFFFSYKWVKELQTHI